MTDAVTQSIPRREKTWAELAEEEDEYLEELQNQIQNEQSQLAGKQLTNFQKRMIERISRYEKPIEVGLQQVPERIREEDILIAFKQYYIRDCSFKRPNWFFYLPKEQAIKLVEESNLRITIKGANLLIVMLPLKI
ncbi:unnamed protein product (macronuclear) [Paramecium tetraurelia]|uniref:Uncharacterized protein n=1 Tax=Paramecium tetraurelia TaxID=5888 RepID=A0CVY7_PARTE|nr:uncharacterized protein GSPATT00001156001 [Paramecium tetraurelia]CAK74954.1 unnamed protein product [Paramecium tetraurelia]|eukprot:XP_001442351.1 hypothetical protein (macronuclear) [Paramecium tetraurelia strain d4-2]